MIDLIFCTIAITYLITRDKLFRPLRNFVDGQYYRKGKNDPDWKWWVPHHFVGCYYCVGAWAHLLADFTLNGISTDWRYICVSLLHGIVFGGVGGEIIEYLNKRKAV